MIRSIDLLYGINPGLRPQQLDCRPIGFGFVAMIRPLFRALWQTMGFR